MAKLFKSENLNGRNNPTYIPNLYVKQGVLPSFKDWTSCITGLSSPEQRWSALFGDLRTLF